MAEMAVGRIVSVSGAQMVMLLSDDALQQADGSSLQVGNVVKMATPSSLVFGMVISMNIPLPNPEARNEYRLGEIELMGEALIDEQGHVGRFQRGVSMLPGLGEPVAAATQADLRLVYARPGALTVRIGTIHQDRSLPAQLVVDDLLGRHFAVVGTTGSGKSCAVALILKSIVRRLPESHVVILDVHGEYATALGAAAEVIDADVLQLPYWLLTFEELCEVLFGLDSGADANVETFLLRDVVVQAKLAYAGEAAKEALQYVTVDTPVPYKIGDMLRIIEDMMGRLDSRNDVAAFMRVKARLTQLQNDKRYSFMFPSGVVVRDNLAAILSRIFRVPVAGKPVAVLNLSSVPSEILNVVVSVLCRMAFDVALWGDQKVPILLVCEEAHRYAPQEGRGFAPAKRALSRIAREGRKYALSLCVVSQRPSEVAASVLSQCNTVFALRLNHERDQETLRGAMAENSAGLLGALPSLGNGEAVAMGEGVPVPMRLSFDLLPPDQRPRSNTAAFSSSWREDTTTTDVLTGIVDRWRRQRR